MTALIRKIISQQDLVRIASPDELKKKSLLQILNERFQPYIGKSIDEISAIADIEVNHKAKSFLQLFISSLLGIKGTKLEQIEEFAKANIHLKTVRLEPNGIPKEHMSFKNIDFMEWANEEWEESWLKEYFSETKLLFVVFKYKETKRENPNRKLYFQGITLWNMPMTEIEGRLKEFWNHVQKLIREGIELVPVQAKGQDNC